MYAAAPAGVWLRPAGLVARHRWHGSRRPAAGCSRQPCRAAVPPLPRAAATWLGENSRRRSTELAVRSACWLNYGPEHAATALVGVEDDSAGACLCVCVSAQSRLVHVSPEIAQQQRAGRGEPCVRACNHAVANSLHAASEKLEALAPSSLARGRAIRGARRPAGRAASRPPAEQRQGVRGLLVVRAATLPSARQCCRVRVVLSWW